MKTLTGILAAILNIVVFTQAASNHPSFDSGWRFLRADVSGTKAAGFDDSQWHNVDAPRTKSVSAHPWLP